MGALSKELVGGGLFGMYVGVNLSNLLLAAASQRQESKYINSTAVALSEVLKSITCILSIAATESSLKAAAAAVLQTLFGQPSELFKVAIPAALYTVQNNVIYMCAAAALRPPTNAARASSSNPDRRPQCVSATARARLPHVAGRSRTSTPSPSRSRTS